MSVEGDTPPSGERYEEEAAAEELRELFTRYDGVLGNGYLLLFEAVTKGWVETEEVVGIAMVLPEVLLVMDPLGRRTALAYALDLYARDEERSDDRLECVLIITDALRSVGLLGASLSASPFRKDLFYAVSAPLVLEEILKYVSDGDLFNSLVSGSISGSDPDSRTYTVLHEAIGPRGSFNSTTVILERIKGTQDEMKIAFALAPGPSGINRETILHASARSIGDQARDTARMVTAFLPTDEFVAMAAMVNSGGANPIHVAIEMNSTRVLGVLLLRLNRIGDPTPIALEQRTCDGYTPLEMAVYDAEGGDTRALEVFSASGWLPEGHLVQLEGR